MMLRLIAMLLLSAVLGACGGDKFDGTTSAEVTRLIHQPDSLAFDDSWTPRRIVLEADFDDGSMEDVTALAVWSSADEGVATVSAGDVTPTGAGETVVSAVYEGHTVDGSATVTPVGLGETVITARYDEDEMEIPVSVAVAFSGGEGTAAQPYAITTPEQLNGMRFYTGDEGEDTHFALMGNIDLSDPAFIDDASGWVPIGSASSAPFAGTLDGGGFSISDLNINRPEQTGQGLFGYLSGTVTHLHLESVSVVGQTSVGALAGEIQDSTLQRVTASGDVGTLETATAGSRVGGLVGYAAGSEIMDSGTEVAVTGVDHNIGGLVGHALNTRINTSYARGDVTGNGPHAINMGGLVGYLNMGTVENSYATGSVNGLGIRNGGLVGVMGSGGPAPTVENSYAAGTVNAPDNGASGGLAGDLGDGVVVDSFYTDGQFGEDPEKGDPITQAELADESIFTGAGWDFVNLWAISAEAGRPVLQWEAP